MVKRVLVKNGDAAPFGRMPRLVDDTGYTLYYTRAFFIIVMPHSAVMMVGEKNAKDMRLESYVKRWHAPEFKSCLPGLLVLHLVKNLFINMHMQR